MSPEVSLLQAMRIDRFDNRPQERAEWFRYRLKFLVIGVVQQILIHISHKMNQTFLLWAVKRVVGTIKV